MDRSWLDHTLTDDEHQRFERDGFLVVTDALSPGQVARLREGVERCRALVGERHGVPRSDRVNMLDCIGLDGAFLDLIDHPSTFPKLWRMLGWNISLYHSHLFVTPSLRDPHAGRQVHAVQTHDPRFTHTQAIDDDGGWWRFHRDSGQVNADLGGGAPPRLSVKIAYYLTDALGDDHGNTYVVPGSHLLPASELPPPDLGPRTPGATPVRVPAGAAVFIDRRIFHSSSPNHGPSTREVLFYGYGFRWVRPRDEMTVAHYMPGADPIRRQLLGYSTSVHGYTSPAPEDVPLRAWMQSHDCIAD